MHFTKYFVYALRTKRFRFVFFSFIFLSLCVFVYMDGRILGKKTYQRNAYKHKLMLLPVFTIFSPIQHWYAIYAYSTPPVSFFSYTESVRERESFLLLTFQNAMKNHSLLSYTLSSLCLLSLSLSLSYVLFSK